MSSKDRRSQARSRQYKRQHPQYGVLVLGANIGPELDVPTTGKIFAQPGYLEFRR